MLFINALYCWYCMARAIHYPSISTASSKAYLRITYLSQLHTKRIDSKYQCKHLQMQLYIHIYTSTINISLEICYNKNRYKMSGESQHDYTLFIFSWYPYLSLMPVMKYLWHLVYILQMYLNHLQLLCVPLSQNMSERITIQNEEK